MGGPSILEGRRAPALWLRPDREAAGGDAERGRLQSEGETVAGRGGELGELTDSGGFAEVPDKHAGGFDGLKAPSAGDGKADEIRVHLAHVLGQRQERAGVIAPQGTRGRVDAEQAQDAPAKLRGLEAPFLDPGRAAGVRHMRKQEMYSCASLAYIRNINFTVGIINKTMPDVNSQTTGFPTRTPCIRAFASIF